MNLSESHKRDLSKHVPDWSSAVSYDYHPIAHDGELTLAWTRIDLDLETGEALIEEIQSDWMKYVKAYSRFSYSNNSEDWDGYYNDVLKPQTKKWPDTIMTATIWFLVYELGIKTIFFHTFESGQILKKIGEDPPPKSIYTELPRKFCFEETHNGPLFIRDTARRELKELFIRPETKWFFLDLDSEELI